MSIFQGTKIIVLSTAWKTDCSWDLASSRWVLIVPVNSPIQVFSLCLNLTWWGICFPYYETTYFSQVYNYGKVVVYCRCTLLVYKIIFLCDTSSKCGHLFSRKDTIAFHFDNLWNQREDHPLDLFVVSTWNLALESQQNSLTCYGRLDIFKQCLWCGFYLKI